MILENVPKIVGMIYAVAAFVVLAYLFKTDRFTRRIGYVFLAISAAMGFLVFTPMLPYLFQMLLAGDIAALGAPLAGVLVGLSAIVLLTLLFGRLFCGYLCPIGAVQELMYRLPGRKIRLGHKTLAMAIRLVFLGVIVAAGLIWSVAVLPYFGIYPFFHLDISSLFFLVFLAIVATSIVVYRPFCRLVCPYGALLSLAARKSVFKLRRNDACIECGTCEKICPTDEAKRGDLKQECYLCDRCREVCPVDAIAYRRRTDNGK
ncbi:MAG: 4Fe-4S binding protein [Thermoplasmatota archaeon]